MANPEHITSDDVMKNDLPCPRGRTRCYELIRRGELPAVRIGQRSIRVHHAAIVRNTEEVNHVEQRPS